MKIILSFFNAVGNVRNPAAMPPFYEAFVRGLRKESHQVVVVSGFEWNAEVSVSARDLERLVEFDPDCIITFNNYGPDWARAFDCPIIVYEVDSPIYYSRKDILKANPDRYLYFTIQPHCREFLKREYGISDDRIFESVNFSMIEAEKAEKTCNISFVGSRFIGMNRFPWTDFQLTHPDRERQQNYLRFLSEIQRKPVMDDAEIQLLCASYDIPIPGPGARSFDVLIQGLSAEKRIQVLGEIADLGLDLYGTEGWGGQGGENLALTMSYRNECIRTLQDNQRLYNSSRICINVNHIQATDGFSWRVCDIMASDGCLVTEFNPGLQREFPGLRLETFRTKYEARERCKYILENPGYRDEVVARCQAEINAHHRFANVVARFRSAGIDLSSSGPVGSDTGIGCAFVIAGKGPTMLRRKASRSRRSLEEIFELRGSYAPGAVPFFEKAPAPETVRTDLASDGKPPLVTLFALTYNQEQFVDETLTGMFEQDYDNLELVICDDSSTDATWDIVQSRVREYRAAGGRHSVVVFRSETNQGIIRNVEQAARLSHGELLIANGGDDISLKNRVSRIVDAWLAGGRRAYCIIHGFESIDACSGPFKEALPYTPSKTTPMGAVMAYRREVFDSFPSMRYSHVCEDHPLMRRAIMLGEVLTIPDKLVRYRRGVGVSTGLNYHERRKKICGLGLPAALQTLDDLKHQESVGGAPERLAEARQIAVFCLEFYAREYFSYGLPSTWSMRMLIFRELNKLVPIPVFSSRFLLKRMSCLYPRFVNVHGRRIVWVLKRIGSTVVGKAGSLKRKIAKALRLCRDKWSSAVSRMRVFGKNRIYPVLARIVLQVHRFRCGWRLLRIRARVRNGGGPVRVAFLQLFPASNQNFCIFDKMMADSGFAPMLIVYPDAYRDRECAAENYRKTLAAMQRRFGERYVLPGVDDDGRPIDYTGRFDLMTTSNPYDVLADDRFKVGWWTWRGVPSFYISYFYMGRCCITPTNLRMWSLSCFWKVFAENPAVIELAKTHQLIKGRNMVLSGCPKMDDYLTRVPSPRLRKRILVAPHHAIEQTPVSAGAFAEHAFEFLRLAKDFPEVDFVLRPHPLLWQKLSGREKTRGFVIWGDKKVDAYLECLKRLPNVIISDGGDYLQEFADSDALIHDCGSFQAEYLYTGKPCAYVHRRCVVLNRLFLPLGLKCVNAHYGVRSYEDVSRFIRQVVLQGDDPKRVFREEFARRELLHGYPNVSEFILNDIRSSLGMK